RLNGVQGAEGHGVSLAAHRADGGVGRAERVGDTGGAEPRGDGTTALGEEDADQQQGQAGGRTLLQPVGQVEEGAGQKRRQVGEWHGRLLDTRFRKQESSCPRGRLLSTRERQPLLNSSATITPPAIASGGLCLRCLRKVQILRKQPVNDIVTFTIKINVPKA